MFSRQKPQIDVKKSTQKLLDLKKDIPTRLKHLKLILDNVDGPEAKSLFSTHYSHIYHLVYEGIVSAEGSLKHRGVHRAQREELESVLHLLEKIIVLLPDLLHCRWQLHSFSRLMAKLNHPANSLRLRRDAVRLFLMWYQCLGTSAPNYVHSMFAALIPGLGVPPTWPPSVDSSWGVTPLEITPVLPATSSEKQPDDLCSYFLEILLDFMVSQSPKIHWNDGAQMWAKSIDFLYERFKEFYLPRIFPGFTIATDIYKPKLDVPEPRQSADMSSNPIFACQVVFVKWIANYAHSVYRSMDCYQQSRKKNQTTVALYDDSKSHSTPPSSLSDRDSITSYVSIPSDVDANVIAKDVILGTRANINLLHEVFRRALLMNFVHSAAIRRVICVYKDWIQINVPELPNFMLEPEYEIDSETVDENSESHNPEIPKNRLRTDSYYGAIGFNANNNKEEYLSHLRAGAQKVLRVFFCNSSSVFLLFQIPKHEAAMALLEEQVDVCKRVLNIYRYAVMNTRMDSKTWEQLLVVMLHVTSAVLDHNQPHCGIKYPDSLGHKLASALFQTLIVSWVKASLNVPISTELWDQLQMVLSKLSASDDLITEWAKTMETLTRVLSRHVYNLDLANLPLDRLTEQKAKRKRGLQSGTFNKETFKHIACGTPGTTYPRKRNSSSGGTSERKSVLISPNTPFAHRKPFRRSLSEGNLVNLHKTSPGSGSTTNGIKKIDAVSEVNVRIRKISRSMDSLRKLMSKEGIVYHNSQLQHDWAEISSSTASLENTSTIADGGDCDVYDSGKIEMKGVIVGGDVKGWLPSVAAILWRRMLGILGDVNEFENPKTHAHFFQVITDIWNTLYKIRQNQGVSLDNLSTPRPYELVPPLTLLAPWCLQALELPNEFHRGKVLACDLLCQITFANQDIPFYQEYLCRFYAILHKSIISNIQEIVNIIVKRCGLKFIPKMVPGFSLVILDLIQASHSVLTCNDLKTAPRMEAATLLAGLLTIADIFKDIPVLKPAVSQFQQTSSKDTKEIVMACLLRFAKVEQTSQARAIVLQSLTIHVCEQLMEIRQSGHSSQSPVPHKNRINDIISILMASVKVVNRSVALVASDLLLLLVDFATEISTYFPSLCAKIVLGLKWSLQQLLPLKSSTSKGTGRPVEMERRLFISLMLTLGEWCMRLPMTTLLACPPGNDQTSILSTVFDVLLMVIQGHQTPGENTPHFTSIEDFDASIPFDDLQTSESFRPTGKENVFIRPDSTNSPSNPDSPENDVVKLAARTLMLHLMTQVGHFPIANGAARCGSIVTENDDFHGLSSDLNELSSSIFSLSNVQMFALDNQTLLTMVELPAPDNLAEGVTAGFQTSPTQVRLILRDLSGKVSWDASNLFAPPYIYGFDEADSGAQLQPNFPEELFYQSAMTGIFLPQMGPRLTLRRRQTGLLPTIEDSAEDLDNLDDLLQYIGHTSPECLLRVGEPLTTPWGPPHSVKQENEDDVVGAVVNQRNTEIEYLMKIDLDPTMRAKPISVASDSGHDGSEDVSEDNMMSLGAISKTSFCSSSFLLSRRLFSQFGLTGWDKRSTVDLLVKDEKLLRQLKHLDAQKCREAHKIAIIYVAPGQEDKQSILFNTGGSEAYEDFVAGLGWEVELENHTGFMGGLQKNKSSGESAPYFATSFTEVMFHVSTRMPSNTEECLLQKTRHLGNDEVHIVWSEHNRDYRRDIIPTEFCDVLIVIYPLQIGLFRIQISRKPEVPYFGPLYNEAVVSRDILASLVRATAINASRAKRSSLPFFQHHFQERAKSLSTITEKHKARTSFEQFASNVFCPLLPSVSFQVGVSNRASGTSFSSSARTSVSTVTANSNQLASALLDRSLSSLSGGNSGSVRRTNTGPFTSSPYQDIPLSPNLGRVVVTDSISAPQTPIPPIPPKRLSLKLGSGLRPKLYTPPTSPAVARALSSSNTKQ